MKYQILIGFAFLVIAVSCQEAEQPETPTDETKQVCEPGKSFKKDCNLCRCSNDGKDYACTRKSCPGVHTTADGSSRKKREIECEPNTTFKKDCNTCKCGDDGKMAVCTQRACLGNISKKPTGTTEESSGRNRRETKKVCEPNKEFYKDCNKCMCNDKGTSARCTLIACQPKQ